MIAWFVGGRRLHSTDNALRRGPGSNNQRQGRAWNLSVSPVMQTVNLPRRRCLCLAGLLLPSRPAWAIHLLRQAQAAVCPSSVTQPGTKTGREKASSSTRDPSIGAAGRSLIAARAPSCHMLSRAPVQSRPVPFQLAVGRESRGEAPAPVRPPFPSSLGGTGWL